MLKMHDYALIGARTRLAELEVERREILTSFPALRARPTLTSDVTGTPARRVSKYARARMSEGMRRYWARRRAQQTSATTTGPTEPEVVKRKRRLRP